MTTPQPVLGGDGEQPAGCGDLRHRLEGNLQAEEQLLAFIRAEVQAGRLPDNPDFLRRLTVLAASNRELRGAYAGHVFADALNAETQARTETATAPGRHRAEDGLASVTRLRPRAIHGISAAALLAAAKGHAVSKLARLGLTASVVTASGAAAGAVYTMQTAPNLSPYTAPQVRITPAAASPSARPTVTVQHPKPKGKHHRDAASVPVAAFPAPDPSTPPPSASPPPVAGTLEVAQQYGGLALGLGGVGLLTVTAEGGPVLWTASASAGLTVSVAAGGLHAGDSALITVTADPSLLFRPGTGTVTVNGITVPVSWL